MIAEIETLHYNCFLGNKNGLIAVIPAGKGQEAGRGCLWPLCTDAIDCLLGGLI